MRKLIILVLLALVLAGCTNGIALTPAKMQIVEYEFVPPAEEYLSIGHVIGVIKNIGGQDARYVEIGAKLRQGGVVVATGWTNMTSVSKGESRAFDIFVSGYPEGNFDYTLNWSLDLGGV